MNEQNISGLEKVLDYKFRDPALLREAVTHPSFTPEHDIDYNNQRMEYLGDAVIDMIISEYLFAKYPRHDEGILTKLRSEMNKKESLAGMASTLSLGKYLRLGRGEERSGGREKDSSLADAMEAVAAAVYLDGGLEAARSLILPHIEVLLRDGEEILKQNNPKGMLQEICQKHFGETPVYILEKAEGPDHCKKYTVRVCIQGTDYAGGTAQSVKNAETSAALETLGILRSRGYT